MSDETLGPVSDTTEIRSVLKKKRNNINKDKLPTDTVIDPTPQPVSEISTGNFDGEPVPTPDNNPVEDEVDLSKVEIKDEEEEVFSSIGQMLVSGDANEVSGLIDDTNDAPEIVNDAPEIVVETTAPPVVESVVVKPTKKPLPEFVAETTNVIKEEAPEIIVETEDKTDSQNEASDIVDDEGIFGETNRFSLNNIVDGAEVEFVDEESEQGKPAQAEEEVEKVVAVKIGSSGKSQTAKHFSNFNPGNNVKVVNSDEYQTAILEQYITGTKGGGFTGPRGVTRIILPYSGIYIDISTYTNSDMLGIHRTSNDVSFIEKIETELYSAYEHTVKTSLGGAKLEYVEWLRAIKYPDIWCIYWGIYDVNHPGINTYHADCDNVNRDPDPCRTHLTEKRDNCDITFVSDESMEDIDAEVINSIRAGVNRTFIKSYNVAETLIEKETYLPDSKFKIFQGMPNLEEVLRYLKFLKTELNEDDELIKKVLYPISWIQYDRSISRATISKILAYKYCLFTRKIYAPVYEEVPNTDSTGKAKIKVTYVDVNPIMIPALLDKLSKEDFKELTRGKELKKIMTREGIYFRVKNIVCPNCKDKQLDISLDMRDVIFTRAAALTDFLISM